MKRPGLSLLCCLITAAALEAGQLPLRRYSTADGLPSNQINHIFSDSRGFLWFATAEGLSRYDGYGFTNLTTQNGLPHRSVFQVLEDRRGMYWLATPKGLVRFRPDLPASSPDRLIVFKPGPGNREQYVNHVLEDHEGRIWCGTQTGVYVLDPREPSPHVTLVSAGLPGKKQWDSNVQALAEDREGAIWLGMWDGTLYRRLPEGRVEHYTSAEGLPSTSPGSPPWEIEDLLTDRQGRIWVATVKGFYRLALHPRLGSNIVEYRPAKAEGLPRTRVYSLFQSSQGDIWAGMFLALAKYVCDGCPVQVWNKQDGIFDLGVLSVAEDRDGNFWFGSSQLGASKLSSGGFVAYSTREGVRGFNSFGIAESNGGELYAAASSEQAGLFINVRRKNRFVAIEPRTPRTHDFGWRPARAILQDRTGEWWITTNHGLLRYPSVDDPLQLAKVAPRAVYTTHDGLPSDEVIRLHEDRRGDLWVGTNSRTVTVWGRKEQSFRSISGVVGGHPSSFGEDGAGQMWIGDEEGGLWRVQKDRLTPVGGPGDGRGWVNGVLADRAGRLWVATSSKGLLRFDHPNDPDPHYRQYDQASGLSSSIIRCLVEDQYGSVLLGTGNGVDRLDPESGRVRHYTTAEGAPPGEILSAYRDKSGAIWFAGQQTLTRIDPQPLQTGVPPATWITGVSVGGQAQPGLSELGESKIHGLTVPSGRESFQFDLLALSYMPGDPPRYQYRLGPGSWSPPIPSRSIHYGSLSPGRHRFEVRAVDADGNASPEPAVVEFQVVPPVWQRWWLYALAASMLASAAIWAHRLRVNKLLQLERVRMGIATDLHDDVGSSLSRIAILSELAQKGQSEAGETLEKIGGLARELIDSTSDIVWAVHPHREHLSDLKRRMRHFATDILSPRNISLIWKTPETGQDFELSSILRRQVYLIFKESVHNISRHSTASQAVVELKTVRGELTLEISDNGRGFDLSQDGQGNGLKSMHARAKQLGGSFELRSNSGQGTSIMLRVPLPE